MTRTLPWWTGIIVLSPAKLAKVENVQLICAVNGLANGYPNYVNWARVRSVQTWTDQDDDKESSTLHSMDAGPFQSF